MTPELIYKVTPINNSYKETFKLLLSYLSKLYNILDFDFNQFYLTTVFNIDPDEVRITPQNLSVGFYKPTLLYVYVFVLYGKVSLVSGYGHKIYEYKLDNKKICIFWDISNRFFETEVKIKNFGIKEIRQMKLKKLNKTDIFEYN